MLLYSHQKHQFKLITIHYVSMLIYLALLTAKINTKNYLERANISKNGFY